VHAVVQGGRRLTSPFRRRWAQAVKPLPAANTAGTDIPRNHPQGEAGERAIRAEDYGRHLRTIGQELQKIHPDTFNLECRETSYLIRLRSERWEQEHRSLSHQENDWRPKWLPTRNRIAFSERNDERASLSAPYVSMEFSRNDLDCLDGIAKNQRLHTSGFTDGHSLSQLLRTLGTLVTQRNHYLLGISWRELSICIVVETVQGKREIEVFRPDNLYDLWVRMYLRRENKHLSDIPH